MLSWISGRSSREFEVWNNKALKKPRADLQETDFVLSRILKACLKISVFTGKGRMSDDCLSNVWFSGCKLFTVWRYNFNHFRDDILFLIYVGFSDIGKKEETPFECNQAGSFWGCGITIKEAQFFGLNLPKALSVARPLCLKWEWLARRLIRLSLVMKDEATN